MQRASLTLLILLCISPTVGLAKTTKPSPSQAPTVSVLKNKVILLDPGHAVIDFNGTILNTGRQSRDGSMEHKLNFNMVQKLGALLQEAGAHVYYTRTENDYWRQAYSTVDDNRARGLLANELKADAFISIHCDWSPYKKMQGVTTYYKKENSKKLAELVQINLVKKLNAQNRKAVQDSYTILDTAVPPSILVETGFLSHRFEHKKLAKASYQKDVALAIVQGIKTYFKTLKT